MIPIRAVSFVLVALLCTALNAHAQNIIAAGSRNVKNYGAKGDGVSDDTQAFLDALNQGRDNHPPFLSAVAVYVPPGTYLIKKTLILWRQTLPFGEWTAPPTLVLAPNSPDFQDPKDPKPFLVTAGGYNLSPYSTDWKTLDYSSGNFSQARARINLYQALANGGAPLDFFGAEGYAMNIKYGNYSDPATMLDSLSNNWGNATNTAIMFSEWSPMQYQEGTGYYSRQVDCWQALINKMIANQYVIGMTGPWGGPRLSAVDTAYGGVANWMWNDTTSNAPMDPDNTGNIGPGAITLTLGWAQSNVPKFVATSSNAPSISSLTPATGAFNAGVQVSITGVHFTGATSVGFGSATITGGNVHVNSDTSITVTAPIATALGPVNATVTTPNGTSTAAVFTYNLMVNYGANGNSASGQSLQVPWNSNQVAGNTNLIFAAVSGAGTPSLTDTLGNTYSLIVGPVNSSDGGCNGAVFLCTGITAGTNSVTLNVNATVTYLGLCMLELQGNLVFAGSSTSGSGSPASSGSITTASANEILISCLVDNGGGTPGTLQSGCATQITGPFARWIEAAISGAAGSYNDSQTMTIPPNNTLVWSSLLCALKPGAPPGPPTVTNISPKSGGTAGSTLLTVTGTNLSGATSVHVGTGLATNLSVSFSTSLTCKTPAGSAGAVDVTVTTPQGTSATSSADQYAAGEPSVTGISPSNGSTYGGVTTVAITESGFTGATAVNFGTNPAKFTFNSDTSITATAPRAASTGVVDSGGGSVPYGSIQQSGARNVKKGSAYGGANAVGDGVTDDTQAFLDALNIGRYQGANHVFLPVSIYVPPGTYLVKNTLILWENTEIFGDPNNHPNVILAANSPNFASGANPFVVTAGGYNEAAYSTDWSTRTTNSTNGTTNNTFYIYLRDINFTVRPGNAGCSDVVLWACAQQTSLRGCVLTGDSATTNVIRCDLTGGGGVIENVTCNAAGTNTALSHNDCYEILYRGCTFNGAITSANSGQCRAANFIHCTFNNPSGVGFQPKNGMMWWGAYDCTITANTPFDIGTIKTGSSGSGGNAWHIENFQWPNLSAVPSALQTFADSTGKIAQYTNASTSGTPALYYNTAVAGGGTSGINSAAKGSPWPDPVYPYPTSVCVNVKSYGATGNGSTDDTSAINAAYAASNEVYFPPGTYKYTGQLVLGAGKKMFGCGANISILTIATTSGTAALSVTGNGTGGVVIVGMDIYQTSTGGVLSWAGDPSSLVIDVRMTFFQTVSATSTAFVFSAGGGFFENGSWGTLAASGPATGFQINSTGPLFLYSVQPEHYTTTAVLVNGASNVFWQNCECESTPVPVSITGNSTNIYFHGVFETGPADIVESVTGCSVALFGVTGLSGTAGEVKWNTSEYGLTNNILDAFVVSPLSPAPNLTYPGQRGLDAAQKQCRRLQSDSQLRHSTR